MDQDQANNPIPAHSGSIFDQVVDKLQSANNVLVTVSKNPTPDQLAACIGMTLILNKLGKHATAVFSGEVPSTIDFLQPEKTLEKNTDSLRDFIIALDKSKADKLRYKIEDELVKIFITPYKTSIDEKDLEFSQGDFNVDAVVALGVHDRVQLDQTILAHGRILHDAVVMSFNTKTGHKLGSIPWVEPKASSLCEMVGDVGYKLSATVFDPQISTALLTGIVAETERFSNQKASPHTMSIAGVLMSAGASPQLVSAKLEEAHKKEKETKKPENNNETQPKQPNDDGLIKIDHQEQKPEEKEDKAPPPPPPDDNEVPDVPGAIFEEHNGQESAEESPPAEEDRPTSKYLKEPPTMGGQLTANAVPEYKQYSDTTDPLSATDNNRAPIIGSKDNKTLEQIEESVGSPHLNKADENSLQEAQKAVEEAANSDENVIPQPTESVGAQNADLDLEHENDSEGEDKPEGDDSSPPPVPPPFLPAQQ